MVGEKFEENCTRSSLPVNSGALPEYLPEPRGCKLVGKMGSGSRVLFLLELEFSSRGVF